MTRPQSNALGAFEIEAGTPEQFLKLLKDREDERVAPGAETLARRAIFVAPLKHVRLSEGIPHVTRRVRAAFAYGEGLVTLTRVTADGHESPPPSGDVEKNDARQEEVLGKIRCRIGGGTETWGSPSRFASGGSGKPAREW